MKRPLTSAEIAEARKVFGKSLDYKRVKVYENWPRFELIRQRRTAVGLGNSARFPRRINTADALDMAWLIHELTHVWQFQKRGWVYLWDALSTHKRGDPYDYGGEEFLIRARKMGFTIFDFNPEQQGDICRDYYYLRRIGSSTKAWEPFINDIRRS